VITLVDIHDLRSALASLQLATRFGESLDRLLEVLQGADQGRPVTAVLLAEAVQTLMADVGFILMRGDDEWIIRNQYGASPALEGSTVARDQLPPAIMAESAGSAVLVRASQGPLQPFLQSFGVVAVIVTPLLHAGTSVGVLLLGWQEGAVEVDETRAAFAGKVAAVVSLALACQP
jgi:hypothetical protein